MNYPIYCRQPRHEWKWDHLPEAGPCDCPCHDPGDPTRKWWTEWLGEMVHDLTHHRMRSTLELADEVRERMREDGIPTELTP